MSFKKTINSSFYIFGAIPEYLKDFVKQNINTNHILHKENPQEGQKKQPPSGTRMHPHSGHFLPV